MKINITRNHAVALAATVVTAAVVLSGCGAPEPSGTAGPAPAPAASAAPGAQVAAGHTAADVAFAQGMIPHHRQAVAMSQLVGGRAGERVAGLATRIERAQGPEIERMRGFLRTWGAPEAGMPGGMPGMGSAGGMAGMMSPQQMQDLARLSGAEFDRRFVQMMIAHHEGAVQMAQTELAGGTNPQARALAREIIDAQQAEIAEMRALLG